MTAFLLDTNIVSAILRKDTALEKRLQETVPAKDQVWLSAVVYYESKRGLLKRDAKKQMQAFETLVTRFEWCEVIQEDWDQAAQLWVERSNVGRPIEDAELLIATQAKRLNVILVTDNEKDFDGLGITIENWRGSKTVR